MQYRRKNQMSPDLFSLPAGPDPLTLKTQKWFLIFLNFSSGHHLDFPKKSLATTTSSS